MKRIFLIGAAALILSGLSLPAAAFECPKHFKATQSAIDDATKAMSVVKDGAKKGLTHTLIDEAKMLLAGAKHNQAKPAAGKYDHARSIAKADSALAFAIAAKMYANR
ncbi:MAG: hypothetical protein VB913_07495 [Rhodospirillales bacterium]|jgi:hypothetical protein